MRAARKECAEPVPDRILELADGPARLHVRLSQLVIERDGLPEVTTPLNELAALVITHPRIQLTQAVMAGMAEQGGSLVICDSHYLPAAMLLPLQAHFVQTERYARQATLPEPARKRLWQQIVQAKISAQSRLLIELHGNDGGLAPMAPRVRSGDPDNLEAQAARRYWPLLFEDPKFRRGREGPDQNAHLNYGYAVLHALVARAICGAGLHPSFGLQHHNRYNNFCLASDLMEPFRPLVDGQVALWVREHDPSEPLGSDAKAWLLQILKDSYNVAGETRSLFDILRAAASSLARSVLERSKKLELPELARVSGTRP